jgi:uncharacterized membrane protein YfcA
MSQETQNKTSQSDMLVTGMILGMGVGVATGQIGWGLSIGLLCGLIVQAVRDRKQGKATSSFSLTTAGIALLTVLAILVADLADSAVIVTTAIAGLGLLAVLGVWLVSRNRQRH